MLTEHEFYVYHSGEKVYARRGKEPPVLAKTCDTPQDAADLVQAVVNPLGMRHDDKRLEGRGFHHAGFQASISPNCQEFVEAAYATATAVTEG